MICAYKLGKETNTVTLCSGLGWLASQATSCKFASFHSCWVLPAEPAEASDLPEWGLWEECLHVGVWLLVWVVSNGEWSSVPRRDRRKEWSTGLLSVGHHQRIYSQLPVLLIRYIFLLLHPLSNCWLWAERKIFLLIPCSQETRLEIKVNLVFLTLSPWSLLPSGSLTSLAGLSFLSYDVLHSLRLLIHWNSKALACRGVT